MTPGYLRRWLLTFLLLLSVVVWADDDAKRLSIGIVANNEPYSSYGPNGLQGFSIDLLDEISRVTGIGFDYRVGSWSEIYAAFLRGDLDAVDEISWRSDRVGQMLFTEPYHLRETVIMHDAGRPVREVSQLEDLQGYRVGVLRDIYYSDLLHQAGLEVTEYDFQSDLVRALSFGWVDAVVGPEVTLSYMARQQGFVNLEVLASVPLQGQEREDFRIAVHNDRPELQQQLNDALKTIGPEWIETQRKRWQEYGGRQLQQQSFHLSPAERAAIRQQGPLRVGLMRDFAPMTFEEGGRVQGLSVDILHRITDLTGLQAVPVVDQWSNLIELFRRGEIDVIANISRSPERLSYTRFTEPYHRMPIVVFGQEPGSRFARPDDLKGFRVGIGESIFYASQLRSLVGSDLKGFPDQASMFRALANGQVDLVLASLPNANHWIRELELDDIHVVGEMKLEGVEGEELRFGLRPQLEALVPVFNKALAAVTLTERRTIENRWLGSHFLSEGSESAKLQLTEKERSWLQAREQPVRYCARQGWMPLAGEDAAHQSQGMVASLVSIFAERLGTRFEYYSAEDVYQALSHQGCDLLPLAVRVPEAHPQHFFTNAYYTLPTIVLGRLEAPFISHLDELGTNPVGIQQDFSLLARLRQRYPGLNLVSVASEEEGIRKVQQGRLYGYIGTLATTSEQLRELGFADVRVLGRVPMDTELAVVSGGQDEILTGLLSKLVASLSSEDIRRLDNEWRAVELREQMDYTRMWQLILAALVLLALMYFWIRKLRRLNQQLARMNRQLQAVSTTDALTGLGNRIKLEQHFTPCFNTCLRSKTPFMVAVLDIDYFKRINDTYGHPAGDACLQALGACIREHFRRESDYLIRFGGEEFVIFCPADEPEMVYDRLETLRCAVERLSVPVEQHQLRLTVSIGYCLQTPARGGCADDWLQVADQYVYQVKSNGRNGVCGGALDSLRANAQPLTEA